MASMSDPNISAVAEPYARSLFELADEQGELEAIGGEVAQLRQLLADEPTLAAVMSNPTIASEQRASSLSRIFKGRISDLTLRFLLVLNRNGRLGELASIAVAFDKLLKAKRGEIDVEVRTARKLDDAQLQHVGEGISKAIGKKAVLHTRVDESLIGGMKIRIADRLIDASVAAQLRRLKHQLTHRGQELMRVDAANLLES